MKWDWRKFYNEASDWILFHGPKVLAALLVLFVGFWFIRVLNRWIRKALLIRQINPSVRIFLQNLISISLKIILLMLAMQVAGIQLTFMSAIIAGMTVAAGLALSGTLQNFVSGILILLMRPYRVGDNISTQGQEGTVTSIQLFYTTVLTFDNKTIIIPNGQLSTNVVVNLSREGKRRLDVEFKFNYGVDVAQVKKVLQDSLRSSQEILDDPPPRIGMSSIEYDKYALVVCVWVNAHGFYDTSYVLREKLITDLKAAGIKLPGM